MGEAAVKVLLNLLGFTTFTFAFIANLNNPIGWTLGVIAVILGIIRCLKEIEGYRIRRVERWHKEQDKVDRQESLESIRKFRSLEKDEYRQQP